MRQSSIQGSRLTTMLTRGAVISFDVWCCSLWGLLFQVLQVYMGEPRDPRSGGGRPVRAEMKVWCFQVAGATLMKWLIQGL